MLSLEKIFFKLCENQMAVSQTQLKKYPNQCQIWAKACVHQLITFPSYSFTTATTISASSFPFQCNLSKPKLIFSNSFPTARILVQMLGEITNSSQNRCPNNSPLVNSPPVKSPSSRVRLGLGGNGTGGIFLLPSKSKPRNLSGNSSCRDI